MKYIQIIFSPTGGTEKVAKILTEKWPGMETIDLSAAGEDRSKIAFQPEDVALIAMPSFGGLAPQVALDRLGEIKGNGAKCVLVAVYGNRAYEDTLVQMEDTAEKCGFRVIAAVSAVAEHSIMHQYATGRPDSADRRQLAAFAEKIQVKLQSGDLKKPAIPGNRPYKKAGSTPLVPKPDKSCVKCGNCAKTCPVQAIDPVQFIADAKKCIACMRCVSICPQKARKVNGAMVSVAALAIKKACSVRKENELFL